MSKVNYVLLDKKSTFIDKRAKIGENVIIYENNRIDGDTIIGDNVTIFPNCFISNAVIGKGSKIHSSVIERSELGACMLVGPFSYIINSKIASHTKISAFSEIKHNKCSKKWQMQFFFLNNYNKITLNLKKRYWQ